MRDNIKIYRHYVKYIHPIRINYTLKRKKNRLSEHKNKSFLYRKCLFQTRVNNHILLPAICVISIYDFVIYNVEIKLYLQRLLRTLIYCELVTKLSCSQLKFKIMKDG